VQDLRNSTVVVTGASSGIGLAVALAFARQGAKLVLAARRQEPLRDAARLCEEAGSPRALPVPTDVSDAAQVAALAREAAAAFGRINIWANVAGVAAAGPFESIPMETQAQLVAINLTGVMNGSHVALKHMLGPGGGRGVIINMASIAGRVPQPFTAAYSASKFGVAGFTDALRYEALARSGVQVCGVYPSFVDTPALRHAANYTGRGLRPVPPVLDPAFVAERIVQLARAPRRAMHVGAPNRLVPVYALAPEIVGRLLGWLGMRFLLHHGPPAPASNGTILAPMAEGVGMRDGWGGTAQRRAQHLGLLATAGIATFLLGRQLIARPSAGASARRRGRRAAGW
jgi:NAD(P)-dependent dehydrogenase (short-subunit alcohol dehydrogenase family)